jgi:hypothetical protein
MIPDSRFIEKQNSLLFTTFLEVEHKIFVRENFLNTHALLARWYLEPSYKIRTDQIVKPSRGSI